MQLSTVLLTITKAIFLGIPEKCVPGPGTSTGGTPGPRIWDTKISRWDPGPGTPKYSSGIRDHKSETRDL